MAEQMVRNGAGAKRLRTIIEAGGELGGADLLGFVLDDAVTEVGGLGGMVHLRGPARRGMRLMASHGLIRPVADTWDELAEAGSTAPSRAVTEGATVWAPVPGGPPHHNGGSPAGGSNGANASKGTSRSNGGGETGGAAGEHSPLSAAPRAWMAALPAGSGLLAVPLLTPGGVAGVLSVLTVPGMEPTPRQRAAVEELAAWAALRLREYSAPLQQPEGSLPWDEPPPTTPLRQALQAIRVGSWEWDLNTGDQIWDESTLAILGMDPEDTRQHYDAWTSRVHPDDLPWMVVEMEQAIRNLTVFSVEYRAIRADGTTIWISARGKVLLGDDGEPVKMVGTVWDSTESRWARDSVSRALRHMSDAFLAVDKDWRLLFVNVKAEQLLGSNSRTLVGRTIWEAFAGVDVDVEGLGVEAHYREAAESGIPVEFDVKWPTDLRCYHVRLVPVPDGLTVYATDVTESRAHAEELDALEAADAERTQRITDLTAALAEALTINDVVNAAAERVLPPFGATGLIVLFLEGEIIRIAGAVGYPQSFLDGVDGLPIDQVGTVEDVYLTKQPVFMDNPEEYVTRYPELGYAPSESGKKAWAFLPLIVSGRTIGCYVVAFSEPRHLSGEERALLTTLSGLIGQASERARLFDREHTRAQALQRGLLPPALPSLHTVTAAARYLPASEGIEVGGDWYDVISLSGSRVALVIGDVMGHGLSEAATMGRLRTAVHTLADLEFSPAELLSRLNELVNDLGDDFFATCLYAVYDPVQSLCTYARAGHPPPAVVHADGEVEFLGGTPDPPLGAARPPFETCEVKLPEGSLLALYTDGLVESADRDMEDGMKQLAAALSGSASQTGPASGDRTARPEGSEARAAGHRTEGSRTAGDESASLERLCDDVLTSLLPEKQLTDDAALLIARTHVTDPADIATWPLPDGPIAAGEARDHVRDQLASWDLDLLTMTSELLVSELVGNAIRYGKGPIELRLLRGEGLICEVSDGSLTTPRIRHASDTDEGGRGLQLVDTLAQRWGTRYTATGKCIWTEQQVPDL
ncbi:SpoIIE family protein phosphatase [Streptomyces sp. NPDC088725]|uniref:SpoIIE family protein phosphatase n=1 Tax=Streptomyces sp. NPDC088725 TaxID=3365873 RepID=UPI00380F169B